MSAIAWFFYGLLTRDVYVATPNILGFTFGVIQMILYIVYKDFKKGKQQENKLPEQVLADIAKMSPVGVDVSKMEEENENRVGGNKRTGDSNASHV
ncbi:uncharacterized protein A4U43_C01F26340 [Asparagus officinalis]|uniref:Bidirectional sugar transporter SWEET n=2 Tax=Asparagus officinalis TaxID=4686 RepID=A0A5P1FS94_ASPOF|nr:uncharacterized protein A4U43_C01F26340 [Asparagus officinalis]